MNAPERIKISLNDGLMTGWHWPNSDKPRMVFAHANGFNAYTYHQMMTVLQPEFDILAVDLRGHGLSQLPADPSTHRSWNIYASDLVMMLSQLDRPADLLSGHSMGASSMLLAAARLDTQIPLALIEPVVLPAFVYTMYYMPFGAALTSVGNSMSAQARRRNNSWPDRASVIDRYSERSPFRYWAKGVLEDYLSDGLTEHGEDVQLSCDPMWEAANFEAQRNPVLAAASNVGSRAVVYRAEKASTVFNPTGLTSRGVRVESHEGLSHLAPMEAPRAMAHWIKTKWDEANAS